MKKFQSMGKILSIEEQKKIVGAEHQIGCRSLCHDIYSPACVPGYRSDTCGNIRYCVCADGGPHQ